MFEDHYDFTEVEDEECSLIVRAKNTKMLWRLTEFEIKTQVGYHKLLCCTLDLPYDPYVQKIIAFVLKKDIQIVYLNLLVPLVLEKGVCISELIRGIVSFLEKIHQEFVDEGRSGAAATAERHGVEDYRVFIEPKGEVYFFTYERFVLQMYLGQLLTSNKIPVPVLMEVANCTHVHGSLQDAARNNRNYPK